MYIHSRVVKDFFMTSSFEVMIYIMQILFLEDMPSGMFLIKYRFDSTYQKVLECDQFLDIDDMRYPVSLASNSSLFIGHSVL